VGLIALGGGDGDIGAGPLGAHMVAQGVAQGLGEQESGDDEGHGQGDRDRGRHQPHGGAAEVGPGDADHRAPPSCAVAVWEVADREAAVVEPPVVAVTFISAVATDSGSGSVSSPASRPSASSTTRLARAAARGSWVTMTTVWPSSSTEDRRMLSTSSPAFESRLPVGSSATMTSG